MNSHAVIVWLAILWLAAGGLWWVIARIRARRRELDRGPRAQLEMARAALARSDATEAARTAADVARVARTAATRNEALTALAWAALQQGYPERAKAALDGIRPSYAFDLHCYAAVESALGRPLRAIQALEAQRECGSLTCDGAKLLVDCHLRLHGIERSVLAALENRHILGAENCQRVLEAARVAGAGEAAERLASALREDSSSTPPAGIRAG
jgi:hypothetical protein